MKRLSGLVVWLLAGCASMTPAQQTSLEEVRAFVDVAARVYQVRPLSVLTGDTAAGVAGEYRPPGLLIISSRLLTSVYRDVIVAHELGHYLLGHDSVRSFYGHFSLPSSPEEWGRTQIPREMDANAKAVGILSRVRSWSERTAVITVVELLSRNVAAERRGARPLIGHAPACEEIADLRARFPAHAEVTARYAC